MAEFTKKVARQLCRRRLRKIVESLHVCACHWDDLDNVVVEEIEEMIRNVQDIRDEMDKSLEYDDER